jgi:hypothetical protein
MCAETRPPMMWKGARRGRRLGTTMWRHDRERGLEFGGGALWWWWCSRVVPLTEVGADGVEWGGRVAAGQQPKQRRQRGGKAECRLWRCAWEDGGHVIVAGC